MPSGWFPPGYFPPEYFGQNDGGPTIGALVGSAAGSCVTNATLTDANAAVVAGGSNRIARRKRRLTWWTIDDASRSEIIARVVELAPKPVPASPKSTPVEIEIPPPEQIAAVADKYAVKIDTETLEVIRARVSRILADIQAQDEDDAEALLLLI